MTIQWWRLPLVGATWWVTVFCFPSLNVPVYSIYYYMMTNNVANTCVVCGVMDCCIRQGEGTIVLLKMERAAVGGVGDSPWFLLNWLLLLTLWRWPKLSRWRQKVALGSLQTLPSMPCSVLFWRWGSHSFLSPSYPSFPTVNFPDSDVGRRVFLLTYTRKRKEWFILCDETEQAMLVMAVGSRDGYPLGRRTVLKWAETTLLPYSDPVVIAETVLYCAIWNCDNPIYYPISGNRRCDPQEEGSEPPHWLFPVISPTLSPVSMLLTHSEQYSV